MEKSSINPIETKPTENSCETGGSCLRGPRMCPGFAMMGGFIAGQLLYYFFASEMLSWIVGIAVFIGLITGMHTRIWKLLRGK
jgi:hypothetical protein